MLLRNAVCFALASFFSTRANGPFQGWSPSCRLISRVKSSHWSQLQTHLCLGLLSVTSPGGGLAAVGVEREVWSSIVWILSMVIVCVDGRDQQFCYSKNLSQEYRDRAVYKRKIDGLDSIAVSTLVKF